MVEVDESDMSGTRSSGLVTLHICEDAVVMRELSFAMSQRWEFDFLVESIEKSYVLMVLDNVEISTQRVFVAAWLDGFAFGYLSQENS